MTLDLNTSKSPNGFKCNKCNRDVTPVVVVCFEPTKVQMSVRPLRLITIALAIGIVGRLSAQQVPLPMVMPANPQPLLPLLQVLDRAGLSGSVEISGVCDAKSLPPFSQLGQKGSDSIPTMLSEKLPSGRGFRVAQDPNGLIRVIEPNVASDFLKLRISHIAFEGSKHKPLFHANYAMWSVLSTPEVVAFIRSNDIFVLPFAESVGGDLPPSNSPHISGTLDKRDSPGGSRSHSANVPRRLVLRGLPAESIA